MSIQSFRRKFLARWGRWMLIGLLVLLGVAVAVGTFAGRASLEGP